MVVLNWRIICNFVAKYTFIINYYHYETSKLFYEYGCSGPVWLCLHEFYN